MVPTVLHLQLYRYSTPQVVAFCQSLSLQLRRQFLRLCRIQRKHRRAIRAPTHPARTAPLLASILLLLMIHMIPLPPAMLITPVPVQLRSQWERRWVSLR